MYNRFANPAIEDHVRPEGTGFLIPWVQQPFHYDVRLTPREYPTQTGTKDLQTVKITLRVLVQPDETKLPKIHRELGVKWHDSVLPSVCNEVLKGIVAEFNAEQLLVQRDSVADSIRVSLERRCKEFDIILRDVAIVSCSHCPVSHVASSQRTIAPTTKCSIGASSQQPSSLRRT